MYNSLHCVLTIPQVGVAKHGGTPKLTAPLVDQKMTHQAKIQDMSNHIGVLEVWSCGPRKQQTNTGWLEAPKKNHGLGVRRF